MNRRTTMLTTIGAVAATALAPLRRPLASSPAPAPHFRRGVNIHHWLNWPLADVVGDTIRYRSQPFADASHRMSADEIRELRNVGFDFVRLTIDPAIFIDSDDARFAELTSLTIDRVHHLLDAGLDVIVDAAPIAQDPRYTPQRLVSIDHPDAFASYAAFIAKLARSLNELPHGRIALELFNEPPLAMRDAGRWQGMAETLHQAARNASSDLPLVMTGMDWGDAHALMKLDVAPFLGSNVFYTFHYYTPHPFTHQGVENLYTRYIRGLRWPAAPASLESVSAESMAAIDGDKRLQGSSRAVAAAELDKALKGYYSSDTHEARIDADFRLVGDWAMTHAIPADRILVGEFGAVRRSDMHPAQLQDRHQWISLVRQAAERASFPWAFWTYRGYGGMALADESASHALHEDDLLALGLRA